MSGGETGPPGEKSQAFTLIVIVCVPEVGVGVGVGVAVSGGPAGVAVAAGTVAVGGLKPGGAAASFAPTIKIRSPDLLSTSAAYVNNGLPASLDSTVACPLDRTRLPKPTIA